MIIGKVSTDGDALVHVAVEGANGEMHDLDRVARTIAVLDTGFNGYLALPADAIRALGMAYRYELLLTLASGEERSVPTYEATIRWNGTRHSVEVVEAGETLAGMALFWGYALRIECQSAGRVEVEALS